MELVVVKGVRRKQRAGGGPAGGSPAGNVRVEVLQVVEEVAHVGDARDVPGDDGAVRCFGGGHAGVVRLDRRPQGGLGRKDVIEQAAVLVGGWHPLANGGGMGAEDSGGAEEDEDAEVHSTQRRLVVVEVGNIQWAPHAGRAKRVRGWCPRRGVRDLGVHAAGIGVRGRQRTDISADKGAELPVHGGGRGEA
eukprot:scaffold12647_cov59-Phaeocystis_antarctica.AAC.2